MAIPLVSIITVTKNSAQYLKETIESVVSQTYPAVEYIIIDGGSDDGTLDIIRNYDDRIAYWCSEPDKNMYEAINKGIDHAKGAIVGVLNSDDRYYDEEVVKSVVDVLEHGAVDGVYGDLLVDYGNKVRSKRVFQVTFEQYLMSKKGTFIPHITLFAKRHVIRELGGYQERFSYAADYDFILRFLSKYSLQYIPKKLAIFRRHPLSITASGKIKPERDTILNENGLLKYSAIHRELTYYWVWGKYYFLNAVQRIRDFGKDYRAF